MRIDALEGALAEVAEQPGDAFSWFNVASSAVALGETARGAAAFDQAREIGLPVRMLWYQFEPFEAYAAEGRYVDLVELAEETLAATGSIEELHYWLGIGLEGLGRHEEAERAWQAALKLNPAYEPALDALASP